MRLNKFISHNSKYSRREADKLIEDGLVKLNKKIINEFGYEVQDSDMVTVKNRAIKQKKQGEVTMVIYNKPKGVLVTRKDDRGRATIYHKLPGKYRHFIPIGRLDYVSEGLLLLTDAPEVAEVLMTSDLPRTYNIKIDKSPSLPMIDAMKNGLHLEDASTGAHEFSSIKSMNFAPFSSFDFRGQTGKYTKLRVTIAEGKNRELRRFFAHFDATIVDLKRVAFWNIELNNLPTNKTRYFSHKEYDQLHKLLKKVKKNEK
ncbi:MAG: rRNA pseudouridine synthase [Sulfurovum sp.]|nr:rRNA pseudouridine synthase [Sulfurovum sp.]